MISKIYIVNVKKLVLSIFVEEMYVLHHKNLQLLLSLGLEMKKNTLCIRISLTKMAKIIDRV